LDDFVQEFNAERPHEALAMQCPAEIYSGSTRHYTVLPNLVYPLHDREVLVTACGRICMHRKRVNISTVLAGQKLAIKEVDGGIWLVSFMSYDLGFIDLEQRTLQPLDNPFGPEVVTHVLGTDRYLCVRAGQKKLERAKGFEPSTPTLARMTGRQVGCITAMLPVSE